MTRQRCTLIGFGLTLLLIASVTSAFTGVGQLAAGGQRSRGFWRDLPSEARANADPAPIAWDGSGPTTDRGPERIEGSFIVELAPGLDPGEVGAQLAEEYGGEVAFVYDEVIGGFTFRGPDDVRDELARDPRVQGVRSDHVVYPLSHRPELVSMGATEAWNIDPADPRYRGAGAVVAVLDTALQVSNPNLGDGDNVVGEPGDSVLAVHTCAGGKAINDSADHGTLVLGTAVGDEGVLPAGKAYHVKIGKSTASESAMVCGLNKVKSWIGEGKTIHAVNVSWGCSCELSSARAAIGQLRSIGVPVMVAAGNSAGAVESPAKYPESVAVSATNQSNTTLAPFSSRGPEVDIAAPGDGITVLSSGGCCWLGRGTSFAAPHAAAGAALLMSLHPGLSVDEVVATLQQKGFVRPALFERALNVAGAARGPDSFPTGAFLGLAGGQEVSGTVTLRVAASDDRPLPADPVAIRIGSGSFQTATLVGSEYRRSWNTCPGTPCPADPAAPVRVEARITDSAGQSTIVPIDLSIDNIDDPPTVSWVTPTEGAQPFTTFDVRVAATDDNALTRAELFLDGVSKGVRTTPASGNQYVWSLTGVPTGTRQLRVAVTDGVNSDVSSTISVQVRDVLYRQGFDGTSGDAGDIGGWTVTGSRSLWHTTGACGAASSAPRAFYYGQDASCTYDTGSSNDGYLTSPTITGLPSAYRLTFRSKEQVEPCPGGCGSKDVRTVEVNYGQGWQTISSATASTDSGTGNWLTRSFALGSATGSLQIRFRFSTGNKKNNAFFGWAVDDILIAP